MQVKRLCLGTTLNLCVSEDQTSGCCDEKLLCPSQPKAEICINNVTPLSITKQSKKGNKCILEFKDSCCFAHTILLVIEQAYKTIRRDCELQEKGSKLQISILLDAQVPF